MTADTFDLATDNQCGFNFFFFNAVLNRRAETGRRFWTSPKLSVLNRFSPKQPRFALIEQYSFIRIVQCANLLIAILSLTNSYLSVRLVALFQQNNNKKINLRASSYSLSKFQSNFPTWPILKGNTTFGLRKISYLNCHPGKCIH